MDSTRTPLVCMSGRGDGGDGGTCPPFAAYVLREGIGWADCHVKFVQGDKKTD